MAYGTFAGEAVEEGGKRRSHHATYLAIAAGAFAVTALILIVAQPAGRTILKQEDIDRNDGTDALVNAILVSRGDSLPTEFAAEHLEINPELPFLGSSAYHGRKHDRLNAISRRGGLHMKMKQARLQSLVDVEAAGTPFCTDAEDCMRNNDYFLANAQFHQAAHDMTMGRDGVALPPNLPGVAWCDPANPDC